MSIVHRRGSTGGEGQRKRLIRSWVLAVVGRNLRWYRTKGEAGFDLIRSCQPLMLRSPCVFFCVRDGVQGEECANTLVNATS